MAVKKAVEEKVAEKKTAAKKAAEKAVEAVEAVEKKVVEKKPAARKTAAKKAAEVIIQSPLGGEITTAEILARIGNADKVYVRVDENKAYWVRGEEDGSVDLW
jgi:hypothetical protein